MGTPPAAALGPELHRLQKPEPNKPRLTTKQESLEKRRKVVITS